MPRADQPVNPPPSAQKPRRSSTEERLEERLDELLAAATQLDDLAVVLSSKRATPAGSESPTAERARIGDRDLDAQTPETQHLGKLAETRPCATGCVTATTNYSRCVSVGRSLRQGAFAGSSQRAIRDTWQPGARSAIRGLVQSIERSASRRTCASAPRESLLPFTSNRY